MSGFLYVAIAPECGCHRAFVVDDPEYPKDTAKSVARFIKDGYRVERMTHADAVNGPGAKSSLCPTLPCPNPRNRRRK